MTRFWDRPENAEALVSWHEDRASLPARFVDAKGTAAEVNAYLAEMMAAHRCDGCTGSEEEAFYTVCEACGYPNDAHQRASECPDETEVREWWGR